MGNAKAPARASNGGHGVTQVSMEEIELKLAALGVAEAVTSQERMHILKAVRRQKALLEHARNAIAQYAGPDLHVGLAEH